MKTLLSSRKLHAFTVLELLCVVAIIAILAGILLPAIGQAKARAKRIACVEQLHQTGIAFTSFAHEHDGKLPMAVPAMFGGSLEFAQPAAYGINNSTSFRHFQTLADELRAPGVVVCPADTRLAATNFVALRNENVSYFVGLNAQLSVPDSILAGDRNVTNDYNGSGCCCILRADPNGAIRWTRELHGFKGNLLFADVHVEESNNPRLAAAGFRIASTELLLPTLGSGSRPGAQGPIPRAPVAASPGLPRPIEPPNVYLSAHKLVTATTPVKASGSTAIAASQVPQKPIAARKIPEASANPSAWLLPKEQAPDPGFSLFPESVSSLPRALARKTVWSLWPLLTLLAVSLLRRFKS